MISKFNLVIDKIYFINKHTLFKILKESGVIEVDLKNYSNWQDKIIYLELGQYIKFLSDDFEVRRIKLKDELAFKSPEVRVQFKHLTSLGYIDFDECS